MLREKIQKTKIAALMLMVASIMSMSFTDVRAEDLLYVLTYQMEYKLDKETKTAEANYYMLKNDPMYTEFEIPSKKEYNQEEYIVIAIREGAFAESAYLEKVTIPSTVTEIGDKAFQLCSSLKEIQLPTGLKKISEASFYGCESLEAIEIPSAVTIIEPAAFYECKKLKKVVIPDGVTELGECSFYGCTGLEEVVIPNSVKKIEDAVFLNCDALKQIVIPENVEYIRSSILISCDNLKTIIYPAGVKESFLIEDYAGQLQLSYVVNPDGTVSLTVENLPEGMTDIDLPSDINGRKISSITGPEGMEIAITCEEHFIKEYSKDVSEHWYICSVCKKEIREAHVHKSDVATGSQPCVCGYVPFVIAAQPASQQLPYAYTNSSLAVTVKATFGKEKIAYQWHEDGKAIAGATASTYAIPAGKPVGSYTYICKVTCGGYSQVTQSAIGTVKPPVKGKKYKDDTNMATYKVTKERIDGKGTAEYVKPVSKKKATVIIPATVKIGGVTYKVTSIAKNAFKNNKRIKRLTIEENVKKIGANAFSGCKKLKNITIKTTELKAKKIGANAFKNIKSNATIKVPKKKMKAYKTMLKKKGVSTKAKIRKM